MTAGRGIVHSERTPQELRRASSRPHGLQLWVALPLEHEETRPEFYHHPAASLPSAELSGASVRALAGDAYGERASVKTFSPLFYVEAAMPAGWPDAILRSRASTKSEPLTLSTAPLPAATTVPSAAACWRSQRVHRSFAS
jgi:hypothetical protein